MVLVCIGGLREGDKPEGEMDEEGDHILQVNDRQLACARIQSTEGQDYMAAMAAAANYAWVPCLHVCACTIVLMFGFL